ncbi:FtsQ-type POTRA domain-containing protein [Ornithinimicrobium ciconiae]|uniref:FtsQ-type POTRA domain-containing protein n=1 Tax=Ornithinimicrobium ciconiae TaxID=2594265 RepID=A0A516G9V7_9MICO|nr:cell division protein FtsQ/DivIB [Ornithinimicrobium ciconiae]QDO88311.1 FtsQ-type POTRA domain-containing protein [Ornithinimicrobium ciconiae]
MKETVKTAPKKSTRATEQKAASTKTSRFRFGSRRSGTAHPKLRQRAAEVRRRPWRLAGVLALIAALVGGVIYLFGFSTVFAVEDVTVTGANGEIADGAHDLAAQHTGRPMARVSTEHLESQVLEDLRIASVDVGRSWPSTITLDLRLREPALVLNQSGVQGLYLVDAEGVIYDTVAEAPAEVPVARGPKGDVDPEDLRALQAVPAALPATVADHAEGLRLRDGGQITFTVGAIEVIWGDGANAELKGRVLEGLLAQDGLDPGFDTGLESGTEDDEDVVEAGEEPLVIDLSTPSTPVVTGLQTAEPTE